MPVMLRAPVLDFALAAINDKESARALALVATSQPRARWIQPLNPRPERA